MVTIEKALQLASQAHEGQKDKDGQPYILHPLRVWLLAYKFLTGPLTREQYFQAMQSSGMGSGAGGLR